MFLKKKKKEYNSCKYCTSIAETISSSRRFSFLFFLSVVAYIKNDIFSHISILWGNACFRMCTLFAILNVVQACVNALSAHRSHIDRRNIMDASCVQFK